ncbi:MAG: CARDB domain-containing protein [Thermoplasmata archaeon]
MGAVTIHKREWSDMRETSMKGTALLMALGFLMSAFAFSAPAGAAEGRAGSFVVSVTFTNPDGSHDNSSVWSASEPVNITANVSLAEGQESVTDLSLKLLVNGNLKESTHVGALNVGEFREQTWQWSSTEYGDFTIEVIAINGTDEANQTVATSYYRLLASDIVITEVTLSATTALIGVDTVTITVKLTNNGNKDGPASVNFNYKSSTDEGTLGSIGTEVMAGASVERTFETNFSELTDGEYQIGAAMHDFRSSEVWAETNITLATPKANVTIQDISVSPAQALEGENVTVTATLFNNGTADALNLTVEFFEGETSAGSVGEVDVTRGATKEVTFTITLSPTTGDMERVIKARAGEAEATATVTVLDRVPRMQILDFTVPDGIRIGDTVQLRATVKNVGTADAVEMVVEFYDNTTKLGASEPFNLTVGSSQEVMVNVTITGDPDANHTFFAKALDAQANVTKNVGRRLNPAAIKISSFTVKPKSKTDQPRDSTQSYTLTLVLQNTGELSGTVTVLIMEKTKQIAREDVTVAPGASATKTYTWKVKGEGDHKAVVTLTGDVGAPATSEAKCSLKYTPGFEVVALAAAIAIAAVLLRRRKG